MESFISISNYRGSHYRSNIIRRIAMNKGEEQYNENIFRNKGLLTGFPVFYFIKASNADCMAKNSQGF